MRWSELADQPCSIARTVAVIGDRWTLMILRDCFLRVRRFEEFESRLGITRHLLAERLHKLVTEEVLEKVAYQARPVRYEYRLTPKGLDLYPVMMAIVHWGDTHRAGGEGRPLLHRHRLCGHHFDPVLVCSACGEALDPREVSVEPGEAAELPGVSEHRVRRLAASTGVAAVQTAMAVPSGRRRRARN